MGDFPDASERWPYLSRSCASRSVDDDAAAAAAAAGAHGADDFGNAVRSVVGVLRDAVRIVWKSVYRAAKTAGKRRRFRLTRTTLAALASAICILHCGLPLSSGDMAGGLRSRTEKRPRVVAGGEMLEMGLTGDPIMAAAAAAAAVDPPAASNR